MNKNILIGIEHKHLKCLKPGERTTFADVIYIRDYNCRRCRIAGCV